MAGRAPLIHYETLPCPSMKGSQPSEAEKVSNLVETVVLAAESRKEARHQGSLQARQNVESTIGGHLSSQELSRLTMLCVALEAEQSESSVFGGMETDLLGCLLPHLELHVTSAVSVDLINELERAMGSKEKAQRPNSTAEEWLRGSMNSQTSGSVGPGVLRYFVLRNGLEAASIILSIMTSHGVDQRLINEDCIESCVALLRKHLARNIVPALSNTSSMSERDTAVAITASSKKRRRQSFGGSQHVTKDRKKLYKLIFSSIPLYLSLLERTERFLYKVQLDDRPVVTLCASALSVFAIEPSFASADNAASLCHLIQVASISLLSAICRQYPQHRPILVEDLFPVLLRLPTSKRFLRGFPLPSSSAPKCSSIPGRPAARRLFSGADHPDCIQAISVLVLSLVQCCVVKPRYEITRADDEATAQKKLHSGVTQSQNLCDMFLSQLLQRCARKGEDGGASEFRPILGNLVDDLLAACLVPEYPAAEMLLFSLCRMLGSELFKASSSGGSKGNNSSVESTYLTTAFDVWGKICASLAKLLANHREKPLTINRPSEPEMHGNGGEVNSCFCGRRNLVDTFMLNCDRCQGWYHGECVGVTKDMISDVWICADCRLKQMAIEETKSFASRSATFDSNTTNIFSAENSQVPGMIETHVFRQLVLTYLTNHEQGNDSTGTASAREFLLARWINDLDSLSGSQDSSVDFDPQVLCKHLFELWDKPQLALFGSKSATSDFDAMSLLNTEGYNRLMLALAATTSDLVLSFPRQLGLLMQLMADEALVSMRKLSIKAITQIVASDPKLMLHRSLKKAVARRFRDEAKSVREAIVALVGSYVVQAPEVADAFHSSLLPCLSDEGVSVRKRAIKIFRDILVSNPSYIGRTDACSTMLILAADPKQDDTVRDLIHELFTELWLENVEIPSSMTNHKAQDRRTQDTPRISRPPVMSAATGIVTPNSKEDFDGGFSAVRAREPLRRNSESVIQIRCRIACEHMIEVVQTTRNKQSLGDLLRSLLSDVSDADKDRKSTERKRRKESLKSHCAHLVDALVEHLLTLEEQQAERKHNRGAELLATLKTLAIFAEVSPGEVLKHLDTVLPYLKCENGVRAGEESEIVIEVCDVVFGVTGIMSRVDVMRLGQGSFCDDLIRITYRFGSNAIGSAVKVLCTLAQHSEVDTESVYRTKLLKLAKTFYTYLAQRRNDKFDYSKNIKLRSNIQRGLSVLGSICRNLNCGDSEEMWLDNLLENPNQNLPQSIVWDDMVQCFYVLFEAYLAKTDVDTKCAALKALGGIFVSIPKVLLLMEQSGLVAELMSNKSDDELQVQALKCWKEILVAEERRVESGAAKARMDNNSNITLSKKISGDQDSDATLVGGVLTHHAGRLYELTTSQNEKIRFATVDLLSQLLRQGLLNPMEAVPYLFALQGDIEAKTIRSLALKLLIAEGHKRPDMLRQRACAGIRQACAFQGTVYPGRDVTAVLSSKKGEFVETECIFGSVFKECIRNSKKQKRGLFRNLLELLRSKNELPLLGFAAQVLAHLPYGTVSDPLFIIHNIQNNAALDGAQLLDRLCSFLEHQQVPGIDELNTGEDSLEIAAKKKKPSRSKQAAALTAETFDLSGFAKFCREASSFVVLLRLKAFLRKIYNLSEARCLAYNPDNQERSFDRLVSIPSNVPIFDGRLDCLTTKARGGTSNIDVDAVIRRYAEFRRLMREEQQSDSKFSDSEDFEDDARKRKASDLAEEPLSKRAREAVE